MKRSVANRTVFILSLSFSFSLSAVPCRFIQLWMLFERALRLVVQQLVKLYPSRVLPVRLYLGICIYLFWYLWFWKSGVDRTGLQLVSLKQLHSFVVPVAILLLFFLFICRFQQLAVFSTRQVPSKVKYVRVWLRLGLRLGPRVGPRLVLGLGFSLLTKTSFSSFPTGGKTWSHSSGKQQAAPEPLDTLHDIRDSQLGTNRQ